MPYVSDKQRKFFHTDTAKEHGITPKMVKEFDKKSKGKKLPKRVKGKNKTYSRVKFEKSIRKSMGYNG